MAVLLSLPGPVLSRAFNGQHGVRRVRRQPMRFQAKTTVRAPNSTTRCSM
jgi:hypothetical protein